MRKHPLGPAGFIRTHSAEPSKLSAIYDKGYFIGHAIGGALHINLFPQTKEINRGWSKEGKKYTEMGAIVENIRKPIAFLGQFIPATQPIRRLSSLDCYGTTEHCG